MRGEAADIKCSDNAAIFKLIKDNFIFDQLEFGRNGGNDKPTCMGSRVIEKVREIENKFYT